MLSPHPTFDAAEVHWLNVRDLKQRFAVCRDYLIGVDAEVAAYTRDVLQRAETEGARTPQAVLVSREMSSALGYLRVALSRLHQCLPEEELRGLGIRP